MRRRLPWRQQSRRETGGGEAKVSKEAEGAKSDDKKAK